MTSPQTPPSSPKKRNTHSWKTIALTHEKEAAGLNAMLAEVREQLANARHVSDTWRNTSTFNYRAMLACGALAVAEFFAIVYLVYR